MTTKIKQRNRQLSEIQNNLITVSRRLSANHEWLAALDSDAKKTVLDAFKSVESAINCISQELKAMTTP